MGEANLAGRDVPFMRNSEGLKWASPKSDRLKITSGAVTVRYLVNEQVKQRRLGREYIHAKPYVRIVGAPGAGAARLPGEGPAVQSARASTRRRR